MAQKLFVSQQEVGKVREVRAGGAAGAYPSRRRLGPLGIALCAAFGAMGALGCAAEPGMEADVTEEANALSTNDARLWESKFLGTHNSYSRYDNGGPDHQYFSVAQQLDAGIRALEIDVTHESGTVSHGGNPLMKMWCSTIDECLQQINGWSDAHPGHTPIAVYVEFSEQWSWLGMRRTRTVPTYNKIKAAYGAWVPDAKKITGNDHGSTVGQLRGKIALAVYRKRSAWDPMLPVLRFDGEHDGYLANSKIFIAAKSTEDGDFSWSPGPGTLHFIKADHMNTDPGWVTAWREMPVFFAVNVCKDHDCSEASGDKQRMQDTFNGTLANGLMSNEVEDLQEWLGPPSDASVNTFRVAGPGF